MKTNAALGGALQKQMHARLNQYTYTSLIPAAIIILHVVVVACMYGSCHACYYYV